MNAYSYSPYNSYETFGYSNDFETMLEDILGSSETQALLAVLGILGIVLLVLLGIGLLMYLFEAIGMYKIGKNRSVRGAAMAFFPYFNTYFMGKVADDINAASGKKTTHRRKLVTFMILNLVFSLIGAGGSFLIGFAGGLGITTEVNAMILLGLVVLVLELITIAFTICLMVYIYISLYAIFKEYAPNHAVLFLVLTIFLEIAPFLIFAIRNKKGQTQLLQEQQV